MLITSWQHNNVFILIVILGTIEESILKRQTVKGLLSVVIKECNTHTATTAQKEEEIVEETNMDLGRGIDISVGSRTEARIEKENKRKIIIRSCNSNGNSNSSSSSGSSSCGVSRVSGGVASLFVPSESNRKKEEGRGETGEEKVEAEAEEEEDEEVKQEEVQEQEEIGCPEGDDDDNDEGSVRDEEEEEEEEEEEDEEGCNISESDDDCDDDDDNIGNETRRRGKKRSKNKKLVSSVKRKFLSESIEKSSSSPSSSPSPSSSSSSAADMTPDILLDLVLPRGLDYWSKDCQFRKSNALVKCTTIVKCDGLGSESEEGKANVKSEGEEDMRGDTVSTLNSGKKDFHQLLLGTSLLDVVEV